MTFMKRTGFKPSIWQTGICAGILLLIAGCDPTPTPWYGSCDDVPPCSALNYHVEVSSLKIDSTTGDFLVTKSDWQAYFGPDYTVPALSRRAATSMSCAPCSGAYAIPDSTYFTTDLVTFMGDTLKAGENLPGRTLPVGIHVSGTSVTIENLTTSIPTIRFKDSLFEIRFSGTIDSVRKSASAKFRVADTALLLR